MVCMCMSVCVRYTAAYTASQSEVHKPTCPPIQVQIQKNDADG